jgi:hypothetical protein
MLPAMSMWMSVARVSPAALERMQNDDLILDSIFFGEGDEAKKARSQLGMDADAIVGMDYLMAHQAIESMAAAMGRDAGSDPVIEDLSPSGSLEYEAGYGPAFFLDPDAVKEALMGATTLELDDEVQSLFATAAAEGEYIVGVVS